MKKLLICFLLFVAACGRKDNNPDFESTLKRNAEHARSDEQKITWLSRLAWYYMEVDTRRSDSVMNIVYSLAENSTDKGNAILAYLFDAQRFLSLSDRRQKMETIQTLAKNALNLASSGNYPDYTAYSYIYMAQSSRLLGNPDAAEKNLSDAYNLVLDSKSDSLKLEFYYLRSQVHQDKRELNQALEDALQLQRISERSENDNLRALAYRRLGVMYGDIDSANAKDNYKNFVEISKKIGDDEQLIDADLRLGLFYSKRKQLAGEASKYLHEAMNLSRQINHQNLIIRSHLAMIHFYLNSGQPDSMLSYLGQNILELDSYYSKNGQNAWYYYTYALFCYKLGEYYVTQGDEKDADKEFELALEYFQKSDDMYSNDAVASQQRSLNSYRGAAYYYRYSLGMPSAVQDSNLRARVSNCYLWAIYYFNRTIQLAKQMSDPESMRNVFTWMENLYRDSARYYYNDGYYPYSASKYYKLAYESRQSHDSCDRVFQSLTSQNEKIWIERQDKARREEEAEIRKHQKESIKLIGITAAVAVIFLLLILTGFLRLSEFWIRLIGVFAFLTLFEFIILIIDRRLHEFTHGELVSLLVIKIVIAAILSPAHHFLEKSVIHSLTRRKLLHDDEKRLKGLAEGAREEGLD